MFRQPLQMLYVKDLVKRLKRNPYLRHIADKEAKTLGETHFN